MAEAAIITTICDHNGSMNFDDLRSICGLNNEDMESVLGRSECFVVALINGQKSVIVRTEVRLCRAQNCSGCAGLHLCKWHLFGSCRFAKGRWVIKQTYWFFFWLLTPPRINRLTLRGIWSTTDQFGSIQRLFLVCKG